MRDDVCANCLAFDQTSTRARALGKEDGGLCRQGPPTRLPRAFATDVPGNRVRDEKLIWGWGEVAVDDWCLEHARRPEK